MSTDRSVQHEAEEIADRLNTAEKLVLLLLDAQNGRAIPGNIYAQKEMFLLADKLPSDELLSYLDYQSYFQGPFSETVNNIIEDLEYYGAASRDRSGIRPTKKGQAAANLIKGGTNDRVQSNIKEVKDLVNDLSKDELLVYVYYNYEEYTTESLEKEDLEGKRRRVAKKLYSQDKVDVEEAADLAGVSIGEFRKELSGPV
jgi:predicted HTH domain antitoxin